MKIPKFNLKKYLTAQNNIVEIDGKYYDENLNEVPKPASVPAPKSIEFTIHGNTIILKENEQYRNYFGNYVINSIDNVSDPQSSKITVKYLDGQFKNETKTYPASSQAEAIYSERNRVRIEEEERAGINIIEFASSNEFFTLGYLAKNSRIIVETPRDMASKFETKYRELTGDDARMHIQDNSYYIAPNSENRWHIRCRMIFDLKPAVLSMLSFPSAVNINNKNGRAEINNNNYVYNLFRSGFKLGRNSNNYNSIASGLSEQYRAAFDQGFNA